jgi:hypothetical protein
MATFREPRRVARQSWEVATHLGELDSDVDELHLLRDKDRQAHTEDMSRLEAKLANQTAWLQRAAISGAGVTLSLLANLAKEVFFK